MRRMPFATASSLTSERADLRSRLHVPPQNSIESSRHGLAAGFHEIPRRADRSTTGPDPDRPPRNRSKSVDAAGGGERRGLGVDRGPCGSVAHDRLDLPELFGGPAGDARNQPHAVRRDQRALLVNPAPSTSRVSKLAGAWRCDWRRWQRAGSVHVQRHGIAHAISPCVTTVPM